MAHYEVGGFSYLYTLSTRQVGEHLVHTLINQRDVPSRIRQIDLILSDLK